MAYEGQRQVEVGSHENLAGCKVREPHAEAWYFLGRVDRPWWKRAAWGHFPKDGTHSPYEGSEVFADQNLPHGWV
jgi:hypothetical protein